MKYMFITASVSVHNNKINMEVWCNFLWFWDPWAWLTYFMGLCQQWPPSPSILLDSWSFTVQRWWNLGAKMYQLSSGDLRIMAVCWKRYFTDKLKCGRGRQFSSSFHTAVCEDLLTASLWITNNRLLVCSI